MKYLIYYLTVIGLCFTCYWNSLSCGFVFDDISAIKDNRDLRPHTSVTNLFFNDFWGTLIVKEQSHKSYRPLCVLTFRWNYYWHQLEPYGYHLVNVILHSIVSILYFKMLSSTLLLNEKCSLIATILFAIHPIHTEAVTGVVGRAEILSSVFFLMAFIFYTKATKIRKHTNWKFMTATLMSITTAMLCKEQGITISAICVVYEFFVNQHKKGKNCSQAINISPKTTSDQVINGELVKRLSTLIIITVSLLMLRMRIMGSQLPVFTRFDNPASVSETPTRQLTYNYLVALNFWLLLFPCDLCCDWTMGTIPLITSIFDSRNFLTIFVYLLLFFLAFAALKSKQVHKSLALIMGLSFMVIPFIPASNMFFPVGFVIAERILYMPSMGFCLLVSYGIYSLWNKSSNQNQKWIVCGFIILLVLHGLKTHTRNFDWQDEYKIFMSGLKVNKRNAKLFNNVGHALESQHRYDEALLYFQEAVKVQPDDIGAHINVGRTLNHLKKYHEAEDAYLEAKSLLPKAKPGESYQTRIAPNHLNVFLNLANLIAKNFTRLEEADLLYRQAISMRADYTQAYINRGDILIKLNRTKEAQEVYERALLYDSNNPDIYYNLGVVFLEQGKASQALAYLDKALEIDPEHELALLNSAILLQELGEEKLQKIARQRLLKLLEKNETNERVHFNLGMLAMAEKNAKEAEYWFRQAIHYKEDFRSALFNLALLLADDKRPLEAAPFLNQLVKYHPNHSKGLILLGDIYINNIKDLDSAEMCYKRILELDPNHIQGLHNLCVVYVERGKLLEAEKCFESAYKLAPHENYIKKHLQIVQNRLKKFSNTLSTSGMEPRIAAVEETAEKTEPFFSENTLKKLKNPLLKQNSEKQYSTSSRVMNRETMVFVEDKIR